MKIRNVNFEMVDLGQKDLNHPDFRVEKDQIHVCTWEEKRGYLWWSKWIFQIRYSENGADWYTDSKKCSLYENAFIIEKRNKQRIFNKIKKIQKDALRKKVMQDIGFE